MTVKPVALTIAGSDSGGGAGIQADLKTMEAFDVFGTSAITSVTAQNTLGVSGVEDLSPEMVEEQIDAIADDFSIGAAKTGMLSNADIIRGVAGKVDEYGLPLVVDPVMVAQSGDRLLREEAEEVMRDELVPHATLVTPNVPEAEVLTGMDVDAGNPKSMEAAAKKIVQDGAGAALVKGGHGETEEVIDVLYTSGSSRYVKPRVNTSSTHGTGCALSAAIASELAKDTKLHTAVGRAEDFIYRALRYGYKLGGGHGSVHHMVEIRNDASRYNALEEVRSAVRLFEEEDISPVVPEVGLNYAVATPYALTEDEVAAVEGRITRILDGVKANKGAWFGASGHVARFLLSIREYDTGVEAACNVRHTNAVLDAVEQLDAVEFDRGEEPSDASTMEWSARSVMENRDEPPQAVVDDGGVGKEAMVRLLGGAEEVRERVVELANKTE